MTLVSVIGCSYTTTKGKTMDYRVTTATGVFTLRDAFIIGDGIAGTLDSGASYSIQNTEHPPVEPTNSPTPTHHIRMTYPNGETKLVTAGNSTPAKVKGFTKVDALASVEVMRKHNPKLTFEAVPID